MTGNSDHLPQASTDPAAEQEQAEQLEAEQSKEVQPLSEGVGPMLQRRYWIDFQRPTLGANELMHDIKLNIEEYAPGLLADFNKTVGEETGLAEGDQFSIRILGPWNGDVRVCEVHDLSFSLQTLEGHPEAGTINFSLRPLSDVEDGWHFEINSLAASRDGLVSLAYNTLNIGRKVQEQVWRTFCERVLQKSGGEALGAIEVQTLELGDVEKDTP